MLTFSDMTFKALSDSSHERWLDKAVSLVVMRHPNWAREQDLGSVRSLCDSLNRFSETYQLSQESSFLALVDLVVLHNWTMSVTRFGQYILTRPGFSEGLTVSRFCAHVVHDPMIDFIALPEL